MFFLPLAILCFGHNWSRRLNYNSYLFAKIFVSEHESIFIGRRERCVAFLYHPLLSLSFTCHFQIICSSFLFFYWVTILHLLTRKVTRCLIFSWNVILLFLMWLKIYFSSVSKSILSWIVQSQDKTLMLSSLYWVGYMYPTFFSMEGHFQI